MAALERYFLARGCKVGGYDARLPDLTQALESEGVAISYSDDPSLIPDDFRDPSDTLVVYTPAVPECHAGLSWFRQNGFEVVKRAQVLGRVTRETTAAYVLPAHTAKNNHQLHGRPSAESVGSGMHAFLGGVLRNYNTNYLLDETSPYAVIEADEYDRSFPPSPSFGGGGHIDRSRPS